MRGTNANETETEQTSRGSNETQCKNLKSGLGELQNPSPTTGDRQIRACKADDQGAISSISGDAGSEISNIGKIIERLDALEKRYLDYVNAHKDRLRARLNDAEQNEDEFLKESSSIRDEILSMMTLNNENSTNNNDRPII